MSKHTGEPTDLTPTSSASSTPSKLHTVAGYEDGDGNGNGDGDGDGDEDEDGDGEENEEETVERISEEEPAESFGDVVAQRLSQEFSPQAECPSAPKPLIIDVETSPEITPAQIHHPLPLLYAPWQPASSTPVSHSLLQRTPCGDPWVVRRLRRPTERTATTSEQRLRRNVKEKASIWEKKKGHRLTLGRNARSAKGLEHAISALIGKSSSRNDVAVGQLLFHATDLDRVPLSDYLSRRSSKVGLKSFVDGFALTRRSACSCKPPVSRRDQWRASALEYLLHYFIRSRAGGTRLALRYYDKGLAVRLVRAVVQLNEVMHGSLAFAGYPKCNANLRDFIEAFGRFDPCDLVSDGVPERIYAAGLVFHPPVLKFSKTFRVTRTAMGNKTINHVAIGPERPDWTVSIKRQVEIVSNSQPLQMTSRVAEAFAFKVLQATLISFEDPSTSFSGSYPSPIERGLARLNRANGSRRLQRPRPSGLRHLAPAAHILSKSRTQLYRQIGASRME
ncbi:hypothetical protein LXA43DRAFT_1102115 [Ganoderma leucocontextum]|nr:hypothetical protein LXA43DRAFT_1102115 [Ganoderma leucocontextum]